MRPTLILIVLPFAGAISQGALNRRATTAPDPKWSGARDHPRDHGPRHGTKNDRPAYDPRDDRPPYNRQDDGPDHDSKSNGLPPDPKDDGPRQNSTTSSGGSFTVSILADTNRDGKVDVAGETDTVGKETWTNDVGALFLANIVDTDRRCSSQITGPCASELGDIFNATLAPETPVLDSSLPDRPTDGGSMATWLDSLDERQRALYHDFLLSELDYQKINEIDRTISACNDATDDILRNATYLAPLRTRPIPALSGSATGTITVTRMLAASKVRLFHKRETNGQWVFITSNYTFKAQELEAGLELGIDARDVRRPGGWDGRVTVEFKVIDKGHEAQDSVALRVAPVLTQHHGQAAKQLLTSQLDAPDGRDPAQERFVQDLGEISSSLGLESPMRALEGCVDPWTQDFFEPGYMSIPGPNGPVSLHIMIRSAQDFREAGRKVFQDLRSNTVGAVQHLAGGESADSTGNLETIPPYSYNGKSYPAGRAIMANQTSAPYMVAFLEAQETQAPIALNASWLSVGHIDEFLQFLPAKNKLGWVLMASDPLAGLEILQQAQQAGHGKGRAVSRPRSLKDSDERYIATTIDEVLNSLEFAAVQNSSAAYITRNIDILKHETGLTDADIIRQPCLYQLEYGPPEENYVPNVWNYTATASNDTRQIFRRTAGIKGLNVLDAGTPPGKLGKRPAHRNGARSLERRQGFNSPELDEEWPVHSLYPATINSVVVDRKHIIAPNPWGPVIDGRDVLVAATDEAYATAGYTVRYIDEWFTHHTDLGDVHCGTNVIRHLPADKWW